MLARPPRPSARAHALATDVFTARLLVRPVVVVVVVSFFRYAIGIKKKKKKGERRGFVRSGNFLGLAPRRLVARGIIESRAESMRRCLDLLHFGNYHSGNPRESNSILQRQKHAVVALFDFVDSAFRG